MAKMAKVEKSETSKFKASLRNHPDGTSTIYRPGMPFIVDRTEKATQWLEDQGFKVEEIEFIGDKPVSQAEIITQEV
jgi:hypothetical protein